jgi:hypothetical protein
LHPVPSQAQFGGKPPPAQPGVLGNELFDKLDSGFIHRLAPISKLRTHARKTTEGDMERKFFLFRG